MLASSLTVNLKVLDYQRCCQTWAAEWTQGQLQTVLTLDKSVGMEHSHCNQIYIFFRLDTSDNRFQWFFMFVGRLG